jgi:hypothetical protein
MGKGQSMDLKTAFFGKGGDQEDADASGLASFLDPEDALSATVQKLAVSDLKSAGSAPAGLHLGSQLELSGGAGGPPSIPPLTARNFVCQAAYGFLGDVMKRSESLRFMGPGRWVSDCGPGVHCHNSAAADKA